MSLPQNLASQKKKKNNPFTPDTFHRTSKYALHTSLLIKIDHAALQKKTLEGFPAPIFPSLL